MTDSMTAEAATARLVTPYEIARYIVTEVAGVWSAGKIWVNTVDSAIRVRTGARDRNAI